MHRSIDDSPCILVVDDDAVIAADTVELLQSLGFHVMLAGDARSAMLALDQADLLLTDIVMPGTDGFMLADMAKLKRPAIKVIYATGRIDEAARRKKAAGKIYGPILEKPYTPRELAESIHASLN